MPSCAAVGCSNSGKKGYKIYRFPTDPKRRFEWARMVNRADNKGNLFIPPPGSTYVLCEVHFDEDQFEPYRTDKKLKCSAVPTCFGHLPKKRKKKGPQKQRTKTENTDEETKRICLMHDHQYCSSTSNNNNSVSRTFVPLNEKETEPCNNDVNLTENNFTSVKDNLNSSEKPTVIYTPIQNEETSPVILEQKIMELKMQLERQHRTMINLKIAKRRAIRRVHILKKENIQLTKRLSTFLLPDQLRCLSKTSSRGWAWQSETMKEALQIWVACGTTGYNQLIARGYPFPSIRTLQRHRLNLDLENGGRVHRVFGDSESKDDACLTSDEPEAVTPHYSCISEIVGCVNELYMDIESSNECEVTG